MTNPNLENQKYLFVLIKVKKIINIVKIMIKSHWVYSETHHGRISTTLWV
jgi:hypothetical protein